VARIGRSPSARTLVSWMDNTEWGCGVTADVLEEHYGLTALSVETAHLGSETVSRHVVTDEGQRLFVKEYRSTGGLDTERVALDMSQHCRAAGIPVPLVRPDNDNYLITIAQGSAWSVVDEAPGRVDTFAMTLPLAEHTGAVLGRMHRALTAYPLPERVQRTIWRTESAEDAHARCAAVLSSAVRHQWAQDGHLRADLDQRREDLHCHVPRLRRQLPNTLVEQALHADVGRTNRLVIAGTVTGIIGFRGARGIAAWELGRAAFDPRTVATSHEWFSCALALLDAYHLTNPTLPLSDLRACARIALLDLLFDFDGAPDGGYGHSAQAQAVQQRHWSERQTAIRRLLEHLDDLDDALADLGADTGGP
jgi:homoserine kinase type II